MARSNALPVDPRGRVAAYLRRSEIMVSQSLMLLDHIPPREAGSRRRRSGVERYGGQGRRGGRRIGEVVRAAGAAPCETREFSCGDLFELAQAGSDWIWETDAELRFSWLSENYEQATGVPAEKMLGRFRFDFLKQGPNGSKDAEAHLGDLRSSTFRDLFTSSPQAGRTSDGSRSPASHASAPTARSSAIAVSGAT